jgi:DNA-binding CsgD family transcriptional regulator
MTTRTLPITPLDARWNQRLFGEAVSGPQWAGETNSSPTTLFDGSWHILASSLPQGVMVISRHLRPVYQNQQAHQLCQILSDKNYRAVLPLVVVEICQKLLNDNKLSDRPVTIEHQTANGKMIRVRASWLTPPAGGEAGAIVRDRQYILVFLENRDEILQEELQFEQKKYHLTEREMEIWTLLRQDRSYQEIAATLHISLNTVKTHVKNIYAKKRWNQAEILAD